MAKDVDVKGSDADESFAVDDQVVVFPGTEREEHGVVVEDFGAEAGQPVDVAGERIVEAARRWAVSLDGGGLVFVDSDSLALDKG
jgi:hypothetical protein